MSFPPVHKLLTAEDLYEIEDEHTPDGMTRVLRDGEFVDGGSVLPGFEAPVSEFLPDV